MDSDTPEFSSLQRQHGLEWHLKQQPTVRLSPLGSNLTPVRVSATDISLRNDNVGTNTAGTHSATAHQICRRTSMPPPSPSKMREWMTLRKTHTAPGNDCWRLPSTVASYTTTTAATTATATASAITTFTTHGEPCSCSFEQRTSRRERDAFPPIEKLPTTLRHVSSAVATSTHPPANASATGISFAFFSEKAMGTESSSGGSTSPPYSRRSAASSYCDVSNSPVKGVGDSLKSSESSLSKDAAAAVSLKNRIVVLENQARVPSAPNSNGDDGSSAGALLLPPLPSPGLPKVPTALVISAKSHLTASPSRSRSMPGEMPRLLRSVSSLERYCILQAPLRPQRWSESDEFDDGTPTPADADTFTDDGDSGANVTAAPPARRGKRVGRGFNRKSRDPESSEIPPLSLMGNQNRLTCTASDLTCNTSSTGLLGGHSSGIERNRRTSISFNNRVSVADDDETRDDELHHLCDTSHHESVAQPSPLSLIEADFSALSSTTIFKRDGVTYII